MLFIWVYRSFHWFPSLERQAGRLSSPLLLFSHLRVSRRPLPETYTYPEYKCLIILFLSLVNVHSISISLCTQIKTSSHLNLQIEIAISIFAHIPNSTELCITLVFHFVCCCSRFLRCFVRLNKNVVFFDLVEFKITPFLITLKSYDFYLNII